MQSQTEPQQQADEISKIVAPFRKWLNWLEMPNNSSLWSVVYPDYSMGIVDTFMLPTKNQLEKIVKFLEGLKDA